MPQGTVRDRIENIRSEGAEVHVVDGNYDFAVAEAMRQAEHQGWQIISDTSWEGYTDIPRWIDAGYTTLFGEIQQQLPNDAQIDVAFIPVGVGALAAAAAWHFNRVVVESRTRLISVEPSDAACMLESIRSGGGEPVVATGRQQSLMAGLNCGTPSLIAWPLIRDGFDDFLSISDDHAVDAMRTCYHPRGSDTRIIAGESGAATLGALLAVCSEAGGQKVRDALGLGTATTVLLLNTEGDTDPDGFRRHVGLSS